MHGWIEECAQTPELIAPRLGVSVQHARSICHTAAGLVQRAPQLVAEMRAGRLDGYRAGVIHKELADAPVHVESMVVDEVVARAAQVGAWCDPAGPLKSRARAVLAKVDADFVAARAAVESEFRTLFKTGESELLDTWTWIMLVEDSRQLFAAVNELAQRYQAEDRADPAIAKSQVRTIDQARSDALTALSLEHVNLTIHLHAAIPRGPAADPAANPGPTAPAADGPDQSVACESPAAGIVIEDLPEILRLTGLGATDATAVPAAFIRDGVASGRIGIDQPLVCDTTTGALLHGDITSGFTPSTRRQVSP